MPPDTPEITLTLRDEQATGALAAALAPCVGPGFVLFLSGDLGAGKTAFTRALLRALGHTGRVRSPTFTLSESYNLSNFELYHFDFYRFSSDEEWREAGFDEHVGGAAASVIEWPELAGDTLPAPDLALRLAPDDQDDATGERRIARLHADTERGRRCLSSITQRIRQDRTDGISFPEP